LFGEVVKMIVLKKIVNKKAMNKKGFLRIVEAFIAILIIAGVLLFLYTSKAPKVNDEEIIYPIIRVALKEITTDNELRNAVLNVGMLNEGGRNYVTSYAKLSDSFKSSIPPDYGYYFSVCDIEDICGLEDADDELIEKKADGDVFSDYVVIFTTPDDSSGELNPKKLRLFIWEKG